MTSKVLVVEDSMMVRQQIKRALGSAVLDVLEAEDGVDALEKVETAEIALVVCDVNMPRMNGLDFLEKLRGQPRFATVPVLMLTTEADADLVARSRSLGAKGWIMKPFKPDLLVAAVKRLLAAAVAA